MAARSLGMPVFVTAISVVLLLVGGMAWYYFGPKTGAGQIRPLTAAEQADRDWLQQKAKETNGDYTKLSPDDQRRLVAAHGPQGFFLLRQTAHPVKIEP